MLMRVVHGQWPISPPPTTEYEVLHSRIITGYDEWMSDLRGLATETRSDRRAEAGRFLKWLRESAGKNKPDALTVADIDAYVQSRGAPVRRASRKSITTPSTRAISRWDLPASSNVWIEIRKLGFKTFTPGPFFREKGPSVTSRRRSLARR
jgi:hypothetical protein